MNNEERQKKLKELMIKYDIHSAEYVSLGHPDKNADYISDMFLETLLFDFKDPNAKCAIETMIKGNSIILSGEYSLSLNVDKLIVFKAFLERLESNWHNMSFQRSYDQYFFDLSNISGQSSDIANKVWDKDTNSIKGAGDQGMTYGYASLYTDNMLPIHFSFARDIIKFLERIQRLKTPDSGRDYQAFTKLDFDATYGNSFRIRDNKDYETNYVKLYEDLNIDVLRRDLLKDAKAQVSGYYIYHKDRTIFYLTDVVVSHQHSYLPDVEEFKEAINNVVEFLIKNARNKYSKIIKSDVYQIHINSGGDFRYGGADADAGITGRKTQVDTYGSYVKHGGGAFSGKDFSKVDRSGAYYLRLIAREVVLKFSPRVKEIEIGTAFVIGENENIGLSINLFELNNDTMLKSEIKEFILNNYNLSVGEIYKQYLHSYDFLNRVFEYKVDKYSEFGLANLLNSNIAVDYFTYTYRHNYDDIETPEDKKLSHPVFNNGDKAFGNNELLKQIRKHKLPKCE